MTSVELKIMRYVCLFISMITFYFMIGVPDSAAVLGTQCSVPSNGSGTPVANCVRYIKNAGAGMVGILEAGTGIEPTRNGGPGGATGEGTSGSTTTDDVIYSTPYWAKHVYTAPGSTPGGLLPSPSRNYDLNPTAAATPEVVTNPKLSACLNGWNGPVPNGIIGGRKLDCVEPPAAANTFETLYNAADSGGRFAEGIASPNRLYLRNSTGQVVTGFYREDGARCVPSTGGEPTPTALFTLMNQALASSDSATFLATNHYDSRCTFIVRTALRVSCPTTNPSTIDISVAPFQPVVAGQPLRRRCAAAQTIRVEFDIQDISQGGRHSRTSLRGLSTMPTAGAGGAVGPLAVPIVPIDYRAILIRKTPQGAGCPTVDGTAGGPIATGLEVGPGGLCQIAP